MSSRITPDFRALLWKTGLLVLAAVINYALFSRLLWGTYSFSTWRSLQKKHAELTEKLESLDQRRAALSREIRLLKTDPSYVEKVIRKRLNYVRKDEVLYLFDKTHQNDSAWTTSEEGRHD